jgi:hypothetical protein
MLSCDESNQPVWVDPMALEMCPMTEVMGDETHHRPMF